MHQYLVQQIGPVEEGQYTDRQGQPQTFAERRFLLNDGLNTINAYVTGDRARATPLVREGDFASVQLSFRAREWKDQQGRVHYMTDVYIDRMGTVWRAQ